MKAVTKEQIEEWKKAYGEVYIITVPNEDALGNKIIEGGKDNYSAYFKKVGRKTLSFASMQSAGLQDPIKFNETIVLSTFLGGDEEIKTTDEFISAASEELNGKIKKVEAEIKNA